MKRIIIFMFCLVTLCVTTASFAAVNAADPIPYKIAIEKSVQDGKNTATITITGQNGYHANTLFPWKLTVKPAPGVILEKSVYTKNDAARFDESKVIFSVSYINRSGQKMSAELKLGVCNDRQCLMMAVPLSW